MAELERKAGYGLVIALSITAMIGTGMFFGPAIAASHAGNASIISWVVLALITIYVGSCFAELSSLFPDVGGVYEFAKQAYGRFTSFIVGWVTWLVGSITPAVIIIAAMDYLIPDQASPVKTIIKIGVSIGLLIALNLIALRGVEASTAVLIFFAAITVTVILTILTVGIFHIDFANYTPFLQGPLVDTGNLSASTIISIFFALFFIMETFFGWESATFMGGETKNPEKVIPRSLMIITISVAIIGVLFAIVILGFVPWQTLVNFPAPLTTISFYLFGEVGSKIVTIAIFLALIGSAAGGIISAPRLLLALAKDKLFIEQLSDIHPRFHTPYKAIYFQTVVSLVVILTAAGDYQSLLSLLVPLALTMYIFVLLTIPILRKKFPKRKRMYKAPWGMVGPYLVSLFYILVIAGWLYVEPETSWPLFKKILSFLLFGVPIYILLNMYYNPDLLLRTINSFAKVNRALERFLLPKSEQQTILTLFKGMERKTILEFGSGVGTLTLPLAQIVGPQGSVYATDVSPNNLRILENRLRKSTLRNVHVIHDPHLISRIHPDVPSVDMVFSVGNLSYLQDLKRILKDMHGLLPENGRFCFVEYVDYFWGVIPNQAWLDNYEQLEKDFRSIGLSVRIRKKRGLFWNYLYIYGIKSEYDVPVI